MIMGMRVFDNKWWMSSMIAKLNGSGTSSPTKYDHSKETTWSNRWGPKHYTNYEKRKSGRRSINSFMNSIYDNCNKRKLDYNTNENRISSTPRCIRTTCRTCSTAKWTSKRVPSTIRKNSHNFHPTPSQSITTLLDPRSQPTTHPMLK